MRTEQRFLLLAAMFAPLLAQAAPMLTLSPATGSIQTIRGDVVGWDFTISNPDANFLLVTSAAFRKTTVVAGFTVCDQFPDPALGIFTDYIAQFNSSWQGPPLRALQLVRCSIRARRPGRKLRHRPGSAIRHLLRRDPADL